MNDSELSLDIVVVSWVYPIVYGLQMGFYYDAYANNFSKVSPFQVKSPLLKS